MPTDVRLLERLPAPGQTTASLPGFWTWDGPPVCTVTSTELPLRPEPATAAVVGLRIQDHAVEPDQLSVRQLVERG